MVQTTKNVIKDLKISQEEYEIAYEFLLEEYGTIITLWEENRLKREIKNYLKDSENISLL